MKKLSSIGFSAVIVILSVALFGCSNNTTKSNETALTSSSIAQTVNNDGENGSEAEINENRADSSSRSKSENPNEAKSSGVKNSQSNVQSNNDVYTFEYHDNTMPFNDMLSAYEAPADIIEIDESEIDPSNKDILFEYDDLGRIIRCSYSVNDVDFFQGYTYSDTEVEIFAFCGSTIVDDVTFIYTYDASIGFTESNGYYFNNVSIS